MGAPVQTRDQYLDLLSKPLKTPADLIGKTIAVPPVNRLTVEAMLKLNGIDKSKVKIVPYAYDPTPLIKGEIDGSLDFIVMFVPGDTFLTAAFDANPEFLADLETARAELAKAPAAEGCGA